MKSMIASFPTARARRLRRTDALRALARENHLSVNDLIWPVFICDGDNIEDPVPSMPGVMRLVINTMIFREEVWGTGRSLMCMFVQYSACQWFVHNDYYCVVNVHRNPAHV